MDTVRIPVSVMPYEDPSAKYQKQLKMRKHSDADITEAVSEAQAGKDSVGQVSEASAAEGTSTQTSDNAAAPSDNPRKE